MQVTIRDVAREAGVSVATVSRVLNDSGPVSEELRRRISEIARRLRYAPNRAAQSLATRRTRTGTVGVLLPDLYGEFFSEVIRGIDQRAQRSGYHLLVSSSHADRAAIEAALRAMRGRVDGLIVMSPDIDAAALAANLPESLPVVLLNCAMGDRTFDAITIDNHGGAYAIVRHLASLGHTRIATITGGRRNHDAAERLRGYRAALRASGLRHAAALEVTGDFTEHAGHRGALELLRREPRPTAIFAANDSMAVGALSALRDAGLHVPEDIAVAGFDDIPIARYMSPPLSTVRVAISELGAHAVSRLLEAITLENRHVRRQETLPATLVVRESSGGRPALSSSRVPFTHARS